MSLEFVVAELGMAGLTLLGGALAVSQVLALLQEVSFLLS